MLLPSLLKSDDQVYQKVINQLYQKMLLLNLLITPYTKVSKLVKNGVIVSDNPMDYLLLYRNASEVYSDRVHACIPTLAFGNKARLFSNSPRIALFENAKIPDVRERLVSIEGLKEMQDKQIAFLASLLQ